MTKRSKPRPPKPEGATHNHGKKHRGNNTAVKTLGDVSRELPEAHEIEGWFKKVAALGDRECTMAYGALLDSFLAACIRQNLRIEKADTLKELFQDHNAPLSSLSSKIIVAQTLGIIFPEMRRQIDVVRRIRNAFAHAVQHLDFENETISQEAQKLDCRRMAHSGIEIQQTTNTARGKFEESCGVISSHLLHYIDGVRQAKLAGRWFSPTPFQSKFAGPRPPDLQNRSSRTQGQRPPPPPSQV